MAARFYKDRQDIENSTAKKDTMNNNLFSKLIPSNHLQEIRCRQVLVETMSQIYWFCDKLLWSCRFANHKLYIKRATCQLFLSPRSLLTFTLGWGRFNTNLWVDTSYFVKRDLLLVLICSHFNIHVVCSVSCITVCSVSLIKGCT